MLVIGMSVFSSCSTSIIGTWEHTGILHGEEYAIYYQFKDDGTFVTVGVHDYRSDDFRSDVVHSTWSLSKYTEDVLTIDDERYNPVLELIIGADRFPVLELTEDSLMFVSNDIKVTLKRVSDSVIEKYL